MDEPRQATDRGPGPVFVGRDRELAELRSGLEDAAAGRGRLFLVVGEAGIGKTRLAEELARHAATTAATILWGRCWDGEGAPPFWPWTQALRGLLRLTDAQSLPAALGAGAPYLAHVVPELYERVPALSGPHVSEHARFYLFDAVATFLKRAATASPLVLVFDDLQWADTSSLLLLQFVSHELRDARLLVIGTYREADVRLAPAVAALLGGLVRDANHLPLGGLSERDVARFIEDAAGRAVAPDIVRAVHRETDGNPFFVDEVVRLLAASGGLQRAGAGRLPVPHGVRAAIERRLARVPTICRRTLAIASVIGSEFGVASLAEAGRTTPEDLMQALAPALAYEVIAEVRGAPGVYRFSHALVREALYEDLAPGERVKLHRRIGHALETLYRAHPDDHLAELAHHFAQARPGGDAAKAVAYAVRAARRATAGLAYHEAAVLYARALEAQEAIADERQRGELLLALGDVQWRTADGSDPRETFTQAATIARRLGDPTLLARSALGLAGESSGRLWIESGAVDQSLVSLLEEALDAVGDRDPTVRARLLACLAVQLYYSPSRDRGLRLSEQAVGLARAGGDPHVLVAALRARCVALWRLEDGEERLALATEMVDLAEQTGDREQALPGRRFRVIGFLDRGDVAAVDHEIEACNQIATELRQPLLLSYVARWRAMRALLDGRFGDAEREAESSLELAGRARDTGDALFGFAMQVAIIRMYQGRLEEAARALMPAGSHPGVGRLLRCILACIACDEGRPADARRELGALAEAFAPLDDADAGWLSVACMLSLVCAGLGDAEGAAVLHRLLLPHAQRVAVLGPGICCWGAVSHALGELAATLGRWQDAATHFEDALRVHERMRARPLIASTAYAYGRALLAQGAPSEQERARHLLEQAFGTADELGMDGLAAKIAALREERLPAGVPASRERDESVFRREGDFWTIAYGGRVVRLKDAKGLRDIALLLANPGKEIHVADLIAASVVPGSLGVAVRLLDGRARDEYRSRLDDLRRELDDAERSNDPGRAGRARAELDFIAGELARAHGLGGRARTAGAPAERARQAVAWRVRQSVARVERAHPVLAAHLRRFIRTGTFCSYAVPDGAASWRL